MPTGRKNGLVVGATVIAGVLFVDTAIALANAGGIGPMAWGISGIVAGAVLGALSPWPDRNGRRALRSFLDELDESARAHVRERAGGNRPRLDPESLLTAARLRARRAAGDRLPDGYSAATEAVIRVYEDWRDLGASPTASKPDETTAEVMDAIADAARAKRGETRAKEQQIEAKARVSLRLLVAISLVLSTYVLSIAVASADQAIYGWAEELLLGLAGLGLGWLVGLTIAAGEWLGGRLLSSDHGYDATGRSHAAGSTGEEREAETAAQAEAFRQPPAQTSRPAHAAAEPDPVPETRRRIRLPLALFGELLLALLIVLVGLALVVGFVALASLLASAADGHLLTGLGLAFLAVPVAIFALALWPGKSKEARDRSLLLGIVTTVLAAVLAVGGQFADDTIAHRTAKTNCLEVGLQLARLSSEESRAIAMAGVDKDEQRHCGTLIEEVRHNGVSRQRKQTDCVTYYLQIDKLADDEAPQVAKAAMDRDPRSAVCGKPTAEINHR